MTSFIIRVELHDATYQDYVKLHDFMAQEGFTNTIRSDDGGLYQLPPAEYHLAANCTAVQASDKASAAARKTLKTFSVIASQYTTAAWAGLAKVQARAA